jgi:hypothetical protein
VFYFGVLLVSFAADLQIGQDIELKVLALIQRKYPCACVVDRFKGYDIWIPELHQSVEVKYDVMSCQTGNIVMQIIHCIFLSKLQYVSFVGKGDAKGKKAFLVAKDALFLYGKVLQ